MTLTLEDVKNVRFPIAKRVGEGYRATEVDDFVDRVDATFGSMLAENERLTAQLEALDAPAQATGRGDDLAAENERLRAELEQARRQGSSPAPAPQADTAELERLRAENEQLRHEATELREQASELRQQVETARQANPLTVVEGQQGERVEKIVVSTAAQASPAVTRLVQLATEQAESVVAEAKDTASRTVAEAEARAKDLTEQAAARSQQIETTARAEADRLDRDARANADSVNADAAKRRQELFAALEAERDDLAGRVRGLRSFENTYRENLVRHFEQQLVAVRAVGAEPTDMPELLDAQGDSATPRLDALLAEGRQTH